MNKKKLVTMLTAVFLIAALGVGATLAAFTSKTEQLTNTFTVGDGVKAQLDEEVADDGDTTTEIIPGGQTHPYEDIQPGDELLKRPYMTIIKNSTDCYAFMKVTGIDALEASGTFEVTGFNTANWVKRSADTAGGKDGIYAYVGAKGNAEHVILKDASNPIVLEELFKNVTYSIDATETESNLSAITIIGCAVQAANLTQDEALGEAVWTD